MSAISYLLQVFIIFFQNKIHVPLFFCRDAVSATQKRNKTKNKTKKLPNLINYFVLECVSILYYHRPIVQFVNSWHWRECAKEIKILLNGFIKILGRLSSHCYFTRLNRAIIWPYPKNVSGSVQLRPHSEVELDFWFVNFLWWNPVQKKNFQNPVRDSWDNPLYPLRLALRRS